MFVLFSKLYHEDNVFPFEGQRGAGMALTEIPAVLMATGYPRTPWGFDWLLAWFLACFKTRV